jgi:hypothetical protein
MRGPCQNSTCTFNATRICVLGHSPADCENRPLIDGEDDEDSEPNNTEETDRDSDAVQETGADQEGGDVGAPVLAAPEDDVYQLPASRTHGLPQVNAIMESRPACLIGIVGLAGAGKTAALVSAYLLLSKGSFAGYSYADSDTLRAFEEIARASRTWQKGAPPEQITIHTTLSNDREAGFLHLRLRRDADQRIFDLLLPDLPGEWSRALIDRNDTDRLEFIKSSSVIWLMVDGRQFANPNRVSHARYRAQLLIERLADMLGDSRPHLLIVPTWQDKAAFPTEEASTLLAAGRNFGFEVELAPIASFSWNETMDPGHGVAELFDKSLTAGPPPPQFWPESDRSSDDRKVASFRRDV